PPSPLERSPTMKRKRSHNVSVRLSDEEYERLQYKLSHSDMTLTEFLIKAINGQQIRIIKAYIPLLAELKRQGTNLNQLTHRINEYSSVTQQEINNALQDCRACYQRVYSMTDKITDLISGD
ncbi:MAG: plasmid mobilization relaxosome protein MobC, partial [Clostridia bacterium]|nr:plasmid mobilization relaxosome protein MobC [Clostridia bacterium]